MPAARFRTTASYRLGRLIVLAVIGAGAVVALAGRSERGAGVRRVRRPPSEARLLGQLSTMNFDRFERLCATYYEAHRFRVKPVRWRSGERDAEIYFGTLARPVALLRCFSPRAAAIDVDSIEDLHDTIAASRIPRAIVHAAGRYTGRAIALAATGRIRLVSGADLARSIAGMPATLRRRLLAAPGAHSEQNPILSETLALH